MNKCFYLYVFCWTIRENPDFEKNSLDVLFVLYTKKDRTGNGYMKKFKYFCNKVFIAIFIDSYKEIKP